MEWAAISLKFPDFFCCHLFTEFSCCFQSNVARLKAENNKSPPYVKVVSGFTSPLNPPMPGHNYCDAIEMNAFLVIFSP